MNATEKKARINSMNALRSTGPRSIGSRGIVRWNALKHGLLAKEVVIRRGEGREDEAEFANLLSALQDDLAPVGSLESMLVERIAVSYWRLRRVLRYEVGSLRENLDEGCAAQIQKRQEAFMFAMSMFLNQGKRDHLLRSSMGLSYLLGALEEIRTELIATRTVDSDLLRKCSISPSVRSACDRFVNTAVSTPLDQIGAEKPDVTEGALAIFLDEIDHEALKLESLLKSARRSERLEDERRRAQSATPPDEAVERILRYEVAIEKQLYRAINQLERLQRQRIGDYLPRLDASTG